LKKQPGRQATRKRTEYEMYLLGLMEKEYETRLENRKKHRYVRQAYPGKCTCMNWAKMFFPKMPGKNYPPLSGWILLPQERISS